MKAGKICQVPAFSIKKPVTNRSLQQAPPLRHIGHVVIWEGNYRSDINNIGIAQEYLKENTIIRAFSKTLLVLEKAFEKPALEPVFHLNLG